MSHNPSAFRHTKIARLFPLAKLISNYILRYISTLGLQILLPVPNWVPSKAVLFPSTKKLFWNNACSTRSSNTAPEVASFGKKKIGEARYLSKILNFTINFPQFWILS